MRGATQACAQIVSRVVISTHTPHAGRDDSFTIIDKIAERFLLTRPMRGATGYGYRIHQRTKISTHTPHAGRDFI